MTISRKAVFVIAAVLAAGIIGTILWRFAPFSTATHVAPPKSPPAVSVAAATSGPISRTAELDGSVEASKIARLSSAAEGPIINCGGGVREGDRVKKGQLLICVGRDKTVNAQLAAAQSDLAREKAELERVTELVKNGAIPGDQLEIARTRFENVKAQLARIEETRSDYMIVAPWSGFVSRVFVLEGDYVSPRTPLIEIFDPASLVVRFAIPESESQSVHIGNGHALSITLDAYPEKTFRGRILRLYPKLDPGTRTRLVEAEILENIPLTPGLFARMKMRMETRENAVLVPIEAVMEAPKGGRFVYVVQDGKAVSRIVETGIESGRQIEIVSGLKPGEKVVVAGNEKLKDGMAVQTADTPIEPGTKANAEKPAATGGEGATK